MQQCMIQNQNEMHKFSEVKNGRQYAANNKPFYATFPQHDKIFSLTFPWLLVKSLTFPWQLSNSLTFSGCPDKWSLCIQLGVDVNQKNETSG